MSKRIAKASRTAFWIGALGVATLLALFTANGIRSRSAPPESGTVVAPPARGSGAAEHPGRLVVVAWNIARAGAYRGGLDFASPDDVRARLERMAELIRSAEPDLVFLSEVVRECGPCPVDQVETLARLTGLFHFAFGEEKSFGLPFYRLRSGNALLSRRPLRPVANEQLAGGRPFFEPTNNRRILWCDVELEDGPLRVGSVRNDSFDLANNAQQVRQILARLDGRPALLAGDFNAEPHDPSLALLGESGLFAGNFDGPPTFPARAPRRRIDYVLAPRDWRVVSERVIATDLSDHLPVVAVLER